MSDDTPVRYEERDDLAIITLDRPEKKNTLTDAVIQGVADGIDAAAKSRDVAAIVIRGEGGTLTAGYDLTPSSGDIEAGWSTPYGARGPAPRAGAWDPVRDYQFMNNNVRRFMKIWDCPKPVLGEITGWAVGGATDLILCADLLYMASDAHIGYAPSRMVPPVSVVSSRVTSSLPFVHSDIRPTIGCSVGPNSVVDAPAIPTRFRAASTTESCMP